MDLLYENETTMDLSKKLDIHCSVREKSNQVFKEIIEMVDQATAPAWISVDADKQTIKVERLPEREEIDPEFKEQLIIEFYSK